MKYDFSHWFRAGDTVWFDWDQNGVQDPGELGVSGVSVSLRYVVRGNGCDGIRVGSFHGFRAESHHFVVGIHRDIGVHNAENVSTVLLMKSAVT